MHEDNLSDITQAIKNHKDNIQFTKLGWEPIFMAPPTAKILIIGQAPGIITQEKGEVFLDQSGDRLRDWLGVTMKQFYDDGLFSVLPMDFYFPGHGKSGDLPPRKDFASLWHPRIMSTMPDVKLIILIGQYSQAYYLNDGKRVRITDNVLNYEEFLPTYFPLIHPSPRNQIWISKHPEFEKDILPKLKVIVSEVLKTK